MTSHKAITLKPLFYGYPYIARVDRKLVITISPDIINLIISFFDEQKIIELGQKIGNAHGEKSEEREKVIMELAAKKQQVAEQLKLIQLLQTTLQLKDAEAEKWQKDREKESMEMDCVRKTRN